MLRWRLLTSAIVISVLVALFWLDARIGESAPVLFVLTLAIGILCAWEFAVLLQTRIPTVRKSCAAIATSAVVIAAWWPHWMSGGPPSLALACIANGVGVLVFFVTEAVAFREPGRHMETLGAHVLILSYVGILLALTAQLRWIAGSEAGYLVLASAVVSAKCGDTAAYTFGRLFGRRKMAPRLSPGKTWAGLGGALGGSAVGGCAWLMLATPLFNESWTVAPWYACAAYGLVVGLAGLIGDLCESLIKRDLGCKDSAAIIPGFGGLLDLLDSILFAGPVAYLIWSFYPLVTTR